MIPDSAHHRPGLPSPFLLPSFQHHIRPNRLGLVLLVVVLVQLLLQVCEGDGDYVLLLGLQVQHQHIIVQSLK